MRPATPHLPRNTKAARLRRRDPRTRFMLQRDIVPVILAFCLFILHLILEGPVPWWQRLMGAVPGAMAIYAWGTYLTKAKFNRLPFLEYSLVQFYIFWGSGTINPDLVDRYPVSAHGITLAVTAVVIFCGIFILAYPIGSKIGNFIRPYLATLLPKKPGQAADLVFWPWFGIALIGNTGFVSRLPASLMHTFSVFSSYLPLLVFAAMRTLKERAQTWIFPLAMGGLCLAGLFSGRMRYVLLPLLISGILYLILRRTIPWRYMGMFLFLFIILQPAKHAYRAVAWSQDGQRHSSDVGLTVSRWTEAIGQTWTGESDYESNQRSISGRLNNLSPIALVFDMVPGIIPHIGWRNWSMLPAAPIPRFLYPDKPNFTRAIKENYSLTFGIQTERFVKGSTAVFPLINDGYWSFGWLGVCIVAVAAGLLVGGYSRAFDLASWAGLSIAITMFAELRTVVDLIGMFGGVLQRWLGIALVCWIIWFFSLGFLQRGGIVARVARGSLPGRGGGRLAPGRKR